VAQQEQIRVQLSTNLIAVLSQALCPLKSGKGRVAAYEFMVVTPAIANLIRENKTYRIESSIQTGRKLGMQLLDDHLWDLYDADKITLSEMLDKARQPSMLLEKAEKKQGGRTEEIRKELDDMGPVIGASE
jgi:twitching motility protein PilT